MDGSILTPPYKNIVLHSLKNPRRFPFARCSDTLAGFATTNPSPRMIPKSATRNTLTIPSRLGLNFFKDDPLVAQPGTSFHYSTQGYTLIGCVIEGASGAKYVDFVRQNVLIPAQMEQTQTDNRFAIIPYRTRFYEKTESGTVRNADFLDSSYKIPGGGWLSSAEDMARFEVAILKTCVDSPCYAGFDVDATEAVRRIDRGVWSRVALGRRE